MTIIPKKALGQNFLRDNNFISKIVNSFSIDSEDIVIEIGPGTGALTKELIKSSNNLHLVEIDLRAVEYLSSLFPKKLYPNLSIHNCSILGFDFAQFDNRKVRVIGNIPYYISSEILFHLIDSRSNIEMARLMVQKELAARFVASPGTKDYGIPTVAINLCGKAIKLFDVPPVAFYPQPKVTSSVIDIVFSRNILDSDFKSVMSIVRTAFNHRRKQLRNTLSPFIAVHLKSKGEDFIEYYGKLKPNFFQLRPENLSSDEFLEFFNEMNKYL